MKYLKKALGWVAAIVVVAFMVPLMVLGAVWYVAKETFTEGGESLADHVMDQIGSAIED